VNNTPKRSCGHTKPDGTACLARPQNESQYCFFHDPATAAKRHESQRQGGVERTRNKAVLSPGAAKIRIRGTADVVKLAAATIEQVRCGQLEVRIANSIAQLAGVALKAMEMRKALREDAPTHVSFVMVAPTGVCFDCKGVGVDAAGKKCASCAGQGRVELDEKPTPEKD
jgi:hypothetical protein